MAVFLLHRKSKRIALQGGAQFYDQREKPEGSKNKGLPEFHEHFLTMQERKLTFSRRYGIPKEKDG